ncbi:MAG: hypothetical protein KAT68_00600 [Bacteroidales bacterium]|nr:hypothetical protein [Bacteroidales bacterium]
MNVIKEIMNTNTFIVIAFMTTMFSAISLTFMIFWWIKHIKRLFAQNIAQSILVILAIITIGLIAPAFLIFKSFDWSGWQFWLTQGLCWYALLSFIGLIYMIIKVENILNNTD